MAENPEDKYRGAIRVLIEHKTWTPLLPLRRSSLAETGGGSWAARRQRTATTLHPSINIPDTLIASLSSTALGQFALLVFAFGRTMGRCVTSA